MGKNGITARDESSDEPNSLLNVTLSKRITMGYVRMGISGCGIRQSHCKFSILTALSVEGKSTQYFFVYPMPLRFCINVPEKCAPKILIKFIYINAVQLFRIVVWYALALGAGGNWNGVEKQLLIFPIAWGKQTPMNANRMYWTVRSDYELKLNLMTDGVIVQMLDAKRPMSKPFSEILLINLKVVFCPGQRFGCRSENFLVCIT